jgi:MoxR-like ATPase
MEYQKYFDYKTGNPQKKVKLPKAEDNEADEGGEGQPFQAGDRRDGLVYLYNDKIELAVNVALAAGKPVLVRGPSGSGKSSLARNVARRRGWWYYEQVITSRTQARDLLWTLLKKSAWSATYCVSW